MYNVLRKKGTKKGNYRRSMGVILLATIVGFNAIPIYGKTIEKPIKEKKTVVKEEVILKPEDKMDDALKAKMKEIKASKNPDEKIPVYVWYTDIDQEEVDEQVEEETGLTREGLDTLGMEEPEKLGAFIKKNTSTNVRSADDIEGIKNYLKKTEKQRKKVKEDTDKFIETRREVSKQEYKKHHKKVQKEMKIDKEQVIYESKYAPMVIAKMSCDEIEKVVKKKNVECVELYIDLELKSEGSNYIQELQDSLNIFFEKTKYNKISELAGVSGIGAKVYIYDAGVELHDDIIIGIVKELAPGANINVKIDNTGYENFYKCIEEMVDEGAQVINCSFYTGYPKEESSSEYYTVVDKWADHVIYQHNVTIVKSAGNDDEFVTTPGKAYNVITVGASDGTGLLSISCGEYGTGCFKPDLIAEGVVDERGIEINQDITTLPERGTSYAAPAVTGTIALMLELNPSLAAHPQAIKAILQAGCFQKVTTPKANVIVGGGALREWQGAGILDIMKTLSIVKQHQYGIGCLTGDEDTIRFIEPPYGASKMNVSLAWLRESEIRDDLEHKNEKAVVGTEQDLDLRLYNNDSTLIEKSICGTSSTEMVCADELASDFKYKIRVTRYNYSSIPVRYAYAWATDKVDMDYDRMPTQIYYIKNRANGMYIDKNGAAGTNNLLQYTFHGGTNQRWIIQTINGRTSIKSNHSYDDGVLRFGSVYNTNTDWATIGSATNSNIELQLQSNGAYAIYCKNLNTSKKRALGPKLNDNSIGGRLVWRAFAGTEMEWCLEKINYRKGDVNTNGYFTYQDIYDLTDYINGKKSFSGEQRYLADMNNDGVINKTDLNLLDYKIFYEID